MTTDDGRLRIWVVITVTSQKVVNVWGPFTTPRAAEAYGAILRRMVGKERARILVKSVLSSHDVIDAYRKQISSG